MRKLGVIVILAAIFFGTAIASKFSVPTPDYEGMADCVAEYDYTHPERSMMDNLVIALEECRR